MKCALRHRTQGPLIFSKTLSLFASSSIPESRFRFHSPPRAAPAIPSRTLTHPKCERPRNSSLIPWLEPSSSASSSDSGNPVWRDSPSLVQLITRQKNLCEREVALTSKCATIGTVQESFSHRPPGWNLPRPQEFNLHGQTSGLQVRGYRTSLWCTALRSVP